jgi:hypothetical protein
MRVIHTTEWPWIGVSGRGDEKGDVLNDNAAMKNAQQLGKLLIEDLKKKR